ncbi:SPBc2 prophage-derived glycosyltransferase SunS [compost metagenome]|uniref:tetratricopeptide repeat-containing glycosyltransferase family 2 protein n=1 Tax=Paenibacillus sp. J53TS2 TaxID=2807197 RepID=UPI000F931EED|nr:glycosyltransferase family 2 protein [Paenibacillus sp. J53TS2]GIP47428.1 hypothetical protein J53TS2_10190 [Paenibacillus sp. J53TS2]
MRISVCIIVRDEETKIADTLSCIPSGYEIVILDTGSVDRTKEIARSFGAQIFDFMWCDDFAIARNKACSYASGDYILMIDADEHLVPGADMIIQQFISDHFDIPGAVLIENQIGNEVMRHRMVRFFPNNRKFYFKGIVHELLYVEDKPAPYLPMPLVLQHFGYGEEEYQEKNKFERYIELYRKHLEQSPNDGYMLYQAGKLYYSVKRYEDAEEFLIRSYEQQERDRLYFPVMIVMLGYIWKELGRPIEANELLKEYQFDYPDFPDIPFLRGLLAMDLGDLPAIEQSFLQALEIGETTKFTSVSGVGSYKAAYNLGLFYELTGRVVEAKTCYTTGANYSFAPAIERLGFLQ